MFGFTHLFASSIYGVCGLSLALGGIVFIRNVIRRGDLAYEARFPWRVRLSLYLAVLAILPVVVSSEGVWPNAPWWVKLFLIIVAFAIPPVGLLASLWLVAFRRTRERIKLGKGLLFVSLIPMVLWVGISVDPATPQLNI
jgi:hypothetical protein